MEPDLKEVSRYLSASKVAVNTFGWVDRQSRLNPPWVQYESPLTLAGSLHEGRWVRVHLRLAHTRSVGAARIHCPEAMNIGLFHGEHRVAAIDVEPGKVHVNNKGRLLVHWKERIVGPHRHIWTQEGYGYATPFHAADLTWEAVLRTFCAEYHLRIPGLGDTPRVPTQLQLL